MKKIRFLAIVAALAAIGFSTTGCDNSASPGGGGSNDFGNPFHGAWVRTGAGTFNLTITATSATTGTWTATGASVSANPSESGTFTWRGGASPTADVTGSIRNNTVWVRTGAGGQNLQWQFGTQQGGNFTQSNDFVRAP